MQDETKMDLQSTQDQEKYDAACKKVWDHPEIIAPLLKAVVDEYDGYENEDIIKFIGSVSDETPVSDIKTVAENLNTEFTSLNDKVVYFDKLFKAQNPKLSDGNVVISLHIDLEFQNEYNTQALGYDVIKRGIYYAAREISAQLGTLTDRTNYNDIEKVYSIWICSENIPDVEKNSISKYRITREDVCGKCTESNDLHDLIEVVILRRGTDEVEGNTIFDYLNGVYHSDLQKINEYVPTNPEIEREVKDMSGFGAAIAKDSFAKGVAKGVADGRTEGQNELAKAIKRIHNGETIEDLIKSGVDEHTANLAYSCR